ncbi:MAG: hypothetical protein P8Z67_13220 [Gammaproteobacteria bacterium]
MSKPPDKQDDDAKLFRQAMSGIRRLQHDKIDPHRRKIRPYPAQRRRDEQQVLAEAMAPPAEAWDIETGEELLYSRDGVQNSVMRKLRRGHYRLEAEGISPGLPGPDGIHCPQQASPITLCPHHSR